MMKSNVARQKALLSVPTPAEILFRLSGSWKDNRAADEIVGEIRESRVDSAVTAITHNLTLISNNQKHSPE